MPLAQRSIAIVQDKAHARRIELRVVSDDGNAQVNVDGLQIEQVMTNLFLNAIEASPEGAEVSVGITQSVDAVKVAVSDRGPGIPETIRDHVFDAFFTTRPEGTGLGLSISREIVAAHGGSLSFTTSSAVRRFLRLPRGGAE